MLQRFVASIYKPEWLTIYILGVQALIFLWQSLILRHHGKVMVEQRDLVKKQTGISERQTEISERQREISEKQAGTAELIGKALGQQSTILADQAKIMADQFRFQVQIQADTERKSLHNHAFDLFGSVHRLLLALKNQEVNIATVTATSNAWITMLTQLKVCGQALVTAKHIKLEEYIDIVTYLADLSKLEATYNQDQDYEQVNRFIQEHEDFVSKVLLSLVRDGRAELAP